MVMDTYTPTPDIVTNNIVTDTLISAWMAPMQARLSGWLVATSVSWFLFAASILLLAAALWSNMVLFPFIVLALILLGLVAFLSVSAPRPEVETKKGN